MEGSGLCSINSLVSYAVPIVKNDMIQSFLNFHCRIKAIQERVWVCYMKQIHWLLFRLLLLQYLENKSPINAGDLRSAQSIFWTIFTTLKILDLLKRFVKQCGRSEWPCFNIRIAGDSKQTLSMVLKCDDL